jgi:hypothetical protein
MNQLARVAIVLFGLFWLVQGLATLGSESAEFVRFRAIHDEPDWFRTWVLYLSMSAIGVALASVLPGALLIFYSESLANRLFPSGAIPSVVTPTELYRMGCVFIGVYFAVTGAAVILGGAFFGVSTAFSSIEAADWHAETRAKALQSAAYGGVKLALGLVLYRRGRRAPAA